MDNRSKFSQQRFNSQKKIGRLISNFAEQFAASLAFSQLFRHHIAFSTSRKPLKIIFIEKNIFARDKQEINFVVRGVKKKRKMKN